MTAFSMVESLRWYRPTNVGVFRFPESIPTTGIPFPSLSIIFDRKSNASMALESRDKRLCSRGAVGKMAGSSASAPQSLLHSGLFFAPRLDLFRSLGRLPDAGTQKAGHSEIFRARK